MELIVFALLAAVVASLLYFIIGLIPGTDETASIAPIILLLVLANIPPEVILCFFMAAIAAMETSNSVPSAIAIIPGSTMTVPFLDACEVGRRYGIPHILLRKMLAASVVGVVIALPIALVFGSILQPFGNVIRSYAPWAFLLGALLIALFSKARWAAVLAVLPFATFIGATQELSSKLVGHSMFISFFMGIALGPMIIDIFVLLSPPVSRSLRSNSASSVNIVREGTELQSMNPMRVLGRRQLGLTSVAAAITSFFFVLSPVGMTVLVGGLAEKIRGSALKRLLDKIVAMDAVNNSTYIAETLIPLIAVGLPLSPMALGPAAPLFNAPPRFTIEPVNNIHTLLSTNAIAMFSVLGALVGISISYFLAFRRARTWCTWTLRFISMETLISAFVGLAIVLAYNEAGVVGILATFAMALLAGFMNRFLRVELGVLYMSFYASAAVTGKIIPAVGDFLRGIGVAP
ncbi:MAG: tripartite tricarboxylate transporter permease [Ignavibacteriae bacterium]|nr:tripartite tricarboxylate transporter permease [Ignavibacteriota bacterium]